jgi:hypothetical protein
MCRGHSSEQCCQKSDTIDAKFSMCRLELTAYQLPYQFALMLNPEMPAPKLSAQDSNCDVATPPVDMLTYVRMGLPY